MTTTFRDHFSDNASGYAAARPLYPDALFAWLAARSPGRSLAWDAGCGNGQASQALAARFQRVIATDPSATQVAAAQAAPNIDYRVEPAEASSLASASADLVTVAQAMHWFDVRRFQAEVRRVLRPGGLFAAWSYAQSRVTPTIDVPFDRLHDELLDGWWPDGRQHVIDGYAHLPFAFERVADVPTFVMQCDWNLAQYLAYLRTWSACQKVAAETGRDAVALIEADLADAWGDPAMVRAVRWPLAVHVGRA